MNTQLSETPHTKVAVSYYYYIWILSDNVKQRLKSHGGPVGPCRRITLQFNKLIRHYNSINKLYITIHRHQVRHESQQTMHIMASF